jgi:hypothetical protein
VHWYHAYSSPNGPEEVQEMWEHLKGECWFQGIYASIPLLDTFTVLNCTSSGLLTYTLRGSILTTTAWDEKKLRYHEWLTGYLTILQIIEKKTGPSSEIDINTLHEFQIRVH